MFAYPISIKLFDISPSNIWKKTGVMLTAISITSFAALFFNAHASIFHITKHIIAAGTIFGALGLTAIIAWVILGVEQKKHQSLKSSSCEIRQKLILILRDYESQRANSEVKLSRLDLIQKILQDKEEFQSICAIDKQRWSAQLIVNNSKYDLRFANIDLPDPVRLACTQTYCNFFINELNVYLKEKLKIMIFPQPYNTKNFTCVIRQKKNNHYHAEYYLELKNLTDHSDNNKEDLIILKPSLPLKISFIITKNSSNEWIIKSSG